MPMLADLPETTPFPASFGSGFGGDSDVIELPLLLPRWQVDALENVANQRGMTTGQMIRKVLSELLRAK